MNRISETFDRVRAAQRGAFIPFVSAGDPDLQTSKEIVMALAANGADIIELGVPFSDPMADGPTIQASSQRALAAGSSLGGILEMVTEVRLVSDVPIVLFSYLNPLYQYGFERLSADAKDAGVDAILVTDAINEVAFVISQIVSSYGLDLISLIAPTTTEERLKKIAECSRGFIYAVSRSGVTGARIDTSSEARELVARARRYTDLPIVVGFGLSTREQIENAWSYADGAVVGSAIVAEVERSLPDGDIVKRVTEFVRRLVPGVAKTSPEI